MAEFSRLFGSMSFSKNICLVKDKPVQEWLAIVNAANEADKDNGVKATNLYLLCVFD